MLTKPFEIWGSMVGIDTSTDAQKIKGCIARDWLGCDVGRNFVLRENVANIDFNRKPKPKSKVVPNQLKNTKNKAKKVSVGVGVCLGAFAFFCLQTFFFLMVATHQ